MGSGIRAGVDVGEWESGHSKAVIPTLSVVNS